MKSQLLSVGLFSLILLQINGEVQTSLNKCGRRSPRLESNGDWPWHAAVYHFGISRPGSPTTVPENDIPKYNCGGSLIDTNTVLTAAHCVCTYNQALNAENVLVSVGKQNLSELNSSEFLKTRRIIQHPNYSHIDLSNDIAIIKLSARVTFNNHVQPICLWDANESELWKVVGKVGTIVGWGTTETGRVPDTLRQANMPVVSQATCLESNRNFFGAFISAKTFCAGFRNGTSACGNSGGSLSFEENGSYYIRGIVSLIKKPDTGVMSCDPNEYTLFTDVAQYLSWIAEAKCEVKRLSCAWLRNSTSGPTCKIHVQNMTEQNAKVSIENASENPYNPEGIRNLVITGNLEVLPDLTDVFDTFRDIEVLDVFGDLKSIQRNQLFVARRIKELLLYMNSIEEISPDTFDDLSELATLSLIGNRLKVIHPDVFKELYKLKIVLLANNDLEVLPEGLFRNNRELGYVLLSLNKLKIIATDFRSLPKLFYLDLQRNECIDKYYFIDKTSLEDDFQSEIWNQCKS